MLKLLKGNEATDQQVTLFCPVGTGLFWALKTIFWFSYNSYEYKT